MNTISLGQTDGGLYFPIKITENDHNLLTASSVVEPNAQLLLGTPECIQICADSLPQLPLVDPQNRKGWYYINSSSTTPNKMNWYFYSGANHGYTIADLRMITTVASLTNPLHKFFYVVYTKNGTSRTYETPELLLEGEKCLFFFGESGYIPNNEGNLRTVRLLATHDDGLVLPEMEILFISIHSDSSFSQNSYAVCVESFGYRIINTTMDIILATPPVGGGGSSSDVNILSSVALDIVNQSLTDMSFYTGTNGKYLNVEIPDSVNIVNQSLTDMNFFDDGVKGKYLTVEVPNGVVVKNSTLDVVNQSLTDMTFTTSTFGSKLLNIFSPELTNVHIISQEDDILVKVVNSTPIEVVNIQTLNTLLITEASFNNLNIGGVSGAITLENSSIQSFFGNGTVAGSVGMGGSIVIQFSIDNTNWYSTYNSFFISSLDILNPSTFASNYTFAIKYIRFIITGQEMNTININICYK